MATTSGFDFGSAGEAAPLPRGNQSNLLSISDSDVILEDHYYEIPVPQLSIPYPFDWWGRRSHGLAEVHQNGDPDHQWKG